jgi:hypothetical protein
VQDGEEKVVFGRRIKRRLADKGALMREGKRRGKKREGASRMRGTIPQKGQPLSMARP